MTVAELIKQLERWSDSTEVVTHGDGDDRYSHIESVDCDDTGALVIIDVF